jgi:anti-sigma factor ChrR (cupin superfamily)
VLVLVLATVVVVVVVISVKIAQVGVQIRLTKFNNQSQSSYQPHSLRAIARNDKRWENIGVAVFAVRGMS